MAMTAAGFSGGQAEELRRAFGFKRSERRMKEVEIKLREGMERNGISGEAQEMIVHSITSFALYGFPESHAASFALIAYASAYLKCHYLAAFTAAILNNQPMGFYHPATLVKDAQRHGLHFRPVDVTISDIKCMVEHHNDDKTVRLGLNYVKGLRSESAAAIVAARAARPFRSVQDLVNRVPVLGKEELAILAQAGALNTLQPEGNAHRRAALWDSELARRPSGELFKNDEPAQGQSPLAPMTPEERLLADFHTTRLSIGPHPMSYHRATMNALGVEAAAKLPSLRNGQLVRIGGGVITRQRPSTAKGLVFLSLEDETGVANVIVMPDIFEQNRVTVVSEPFLIIDGVLQNQQGAISVKAHRITSLPLATAKLESHDFR